MPRCLHDVLFRTRNKSDHHSHHREYIRLDSHKRNTQVSSHLNCEVNNSVGQPGSGAEIWLAICFIWPRSTSGSPETSSISETKLFELQHYLCRLWPTLAAVIPCRRLSLRDFKYMRFAGVNRNISWCCHPL